MDGDLSAWVREWEDRSADVMRPGRALRAVDAGSISSVLFHAAHAALSRVWAPAAAAETLVARTHADLVVLKQARRRLRAREGLRPTLVGARAIATLNVAIARMEDSTSARELVRG